MNRLEEVAEVLVDCLKKGNKILTFGVGGNAANAIHFSAELSGKFETYEDPLSCIDLCSNPSVLTAITNDFGWDHVFERQIRALAKPGDVVLAFSISTKGSYLINAIHEATARGCRTILICGREEFKLLPDPNLTVWKLGSDDTPWVQEEQLRIVHQVCRRVKSNMMNIDPPGRF